MNEITIYLKYQYVQQNKAEIHQIFYYKKSIFVKDSPFKHQTYKRQSRLEIQENDSRFQFDLLNQMKEKNIQILCKVQSEIISLIFI
ncbi:hypothetical protein TTHERM_000224509 (macronuclear) [Tetrahymena thermophila SB210]|uniref:Uncharacterized protein n=1 Tax=Tetrahymena thermophila (strain SB210) TaxID=312017 RepID=W7XBJ8_TETTS|nr:hypothetical protein TTHERM_000224509 [Tetrahymena thermophila SB210]EWS74712.1 hypothetical protein TTHERM_000224509 [Tetrahymena thermophila SB210]|eukprot:XP_012652713.1 hypothetical protein TTHERM_000224509 [Tetrahymena thermophila SB210]